MKASIRTRTSVWIGLAAIVGWLLSHLPPKKRRTFAHGSDHDANHYSEKITLASRQNPPKSGGGLLSLALELLGAVAIRLMLRYFKTWSTTLIVELKDKERRTSAGLAGKTPPKGFHHQSGREISSEKVEREKPYQKGIVGAFQKHRE